jgi:hypothetical protein
MAVKRYHANADTTITNAFKADLSSRGTGSNMGASDVLEVFSIYGQASGSTAGLASELARTLIKFPIDQIQTDRTASTIPLSGNVSFYLKMFNAPHSLTLPKDFYLMAHALTRSWGEGSGLDMEQYTDLTYGKAGATWAGGGLTGSWENKGGDFVEDGDAGVLNKNMYKIYFENGTENLEYDITPLVEMWANDVGNVLGYLPNFGLAVKLTGTQEAYNLDYATYSTPNPSGALDTYYTKKFFGRSSEFFFKRPVIEARWDSADEDDRGSFYYSSSLAPGEDNLNTLYLYNYVRGQLRNIPEVDTTGSIMVSLYSGSSDDTAPSGSRLELSIGGGVSIAAETYATGGWYETGIYTCSLAITSAATPISTLYDVWSSGTIDAGDHYKKRFHTGSITPLSLDSSNINPNTQYVLSITNLKSIYSKKEIARFRLYTRKKDWNPTIYTKATTSVQTEIITSASYTIFRIADDLEVVPYNTGSDLATRLSFDMSGNYFDFDMGMLESDYAYGLKFAFYNGAIGSWVEQADVFKFRVEEQRV